MQIYPRLSNQRNYVLVQRNSTSSTASTSSTNTMTMTMPKQTRQKGKQTFLKNEELSFASDTSSLGSRMQIPHALVNKSPSKAAQIFPTSARSSSSSREMLRQEAKVQRLVMQAKCPQEATIMRQMHDPKVVQSMSVKLPAASYHKKRPNTLMKGLSIPFAASKLFFGQKDHGGFREKPSISSTVADTFVREERRRQRKLAAAIDASEKPRDLVVLHEEEDEEDNKENTENRRRAYWRFPRFTSRPGNFLNARQEV